jgi:hypothetical protein
MSVLKRENINTVTAEKEKAEISKWKNYW